MCGSARTSKNWTATQAVLTLQRNDIQDCPGLYDVASGKNGDRVALKKLLQAAYQKEFDAIVVWALDRLSREGMYKTVLSKH